jgi:hypothetical protein
MISETEEKEGMDFRMNQFGDFILTKNGTVLASLDPNDYSLDQLRQEIREVIWVNKEINKIHSDALENEVTMVGV